MAERFLPLAGAPAAPPLYGLLLSARVGSNQAPGDTGPAEPNRWEGGFGYAPENCGGVIAVDACVPGDLDDDLPDNPDTVESRPVYLVAGDRCSPIDLTRDWQGRARRQLNAGTSARLARELWTGELAQAQTPDYPNAYLASADADVLSGAPLSPVNALACLEQGIAEAANGQRGMIHATPGTVTVWNAGGALRREGNLLLTILNTIVVPDAGYPGSSPDGDDAASGSVWAYGTTMVDVRLGEIQFHQMATSGRPNISARNLDRSANTVTVYAFRAASATFDPCAHVAAEIDLPACGA